MPQLPKVVRICRMWRIFNQKNNKDLGTAFLCIDIQRETHEGRIVKSLPEETAQILQEDQIYQLQYFTVLENTQRLKLTTQPYIIQINRSTTILPIEEDIPMMPSYIVHPLRYKQLIYIATDTNYLPDVVGQIRMMQGIDLQNPKTTAKVELRLLLKRSKIVRLTIWDKEAAHFRELQSKTQMKYKVIVVTSTNPRLLNEELILATTPATRIYYDPSNDFIQGFIRENKVKNQ